MMTDRALPAGWRWVRLGEICTFQYGSGLPELNRVLGNVPVYGSNGMVGYHNEALTDGPTIIIGRKGSIGQVHLSTVSCWPIDTTYYIDRHATDQDLRWLAYWLRILNLPGLNKASGVPGLNRDDAYRLDICVPSLPEQKRIAAILTEHMAAIDRARAAAQAQLEAAKSLPAAYLRAVFDGPTEQRWPALQLGDILELRKEVVHPYDHPSGPAIFVGLEHIGSGTGVRTGSLAVEMAELTGRKPRFHTGDIVYGYLRPYLNKVWIAEFDGLCSVDQYVFSVDAKKADTAFVAWFMRSPIYLERAPISTTPGQLPRIRTEEIAGVELNLPPLAEQRRIGAMLDRQTVSTDRLRMALAQQIETIDKLPAALLRQAFNGEL